MCLTYYSSQRLFFTIHAASKTTKVIQSNFSSADGNFEVTLATKATLHSTGDVEWRPPAIYHSSCEVRLKF